ncbi:PhzF family phenazine biosynthesis protein [Sediminihabitans luteus]|uniref:PhzF family phenazine biosynthesis protein n=1 Tax=Sediminihabitans luteus TaxID=1138585 RepID=A0A2M9CD51_9CELL|nr:PhzF family phenazine biosynthesis protein [Sediminihabitans luteus]PJJ69243.1 PhzF family phenazine biosynthesis protein [Sediminihabitans luteus]GII98919.1 phenazine biosynthesis protein PhzF [Sediminihabitans luteus]
MSQVPFRQVDVFTAVPYAGNPVAVVLDATSMSDDAMAAFARWTNLSETTFVLPPTPGTRADYRVRIFTPGGELPFAGHPTLGTCHAWLEAGGVPATQGADGAGVVVQECGVGLVQVRRDDAGRLAFAAPTPTTDEPVDDATLASIVAGLGIDAADVVDHRFVDNGPGWRSVLLRSAEQVLALAPDMTRLGVPVGVVGPYGSGAAGTVAGSAGTGNAGAAGTVAGDTVAGSTTTGPGGAAFEVRAFVPDLGVPEDPVTGSLNAVLAQWLIPAGRAPHRYVANQGTALGRAGRVAIENVDGQVWVGGDTVTCVEGTVRTA